MGWTVPRTWADPELVDDALLNVHLRDNLQYLKDIHDGVQGQAVTYGYAGNDASGQQLALRKSRNTSLTAPAIAQNGDELGILTFQMYDGVQWRNAAAIAAMVHGTPGAGDAPGALRFFTTIDGAGSLTEQVRIRQDGGLLMIGGAVFLAGDGAVATPGIGFNSDQDTGIYRSAADTIDFATGGTRRASITSAGVAVATGVATGYGWLGTTHSISIPGTNQMSFVINGNTAMDLIDNGVALYGETARYVMTTGRFIAVSSGVVPLIVDRNTNDGTLISLRQGGTEEGSISVSGTTVAYNTFTGAHFTQLKTGQEEPPQGAVVVTTGEIVRSDNVHYIEDVVEAVPGADAARAERVAQETRVREVRHDRREGPGSSAWREVRGETKDYLPHIAGTTTEGDPAVYGVWIGQVREDAAGGSFGKNGRPVYNVAGVGTYEVRVTDSGGDIAPGDLLCASARQFEAQRQADDTIRAGTLGKALTGVTWADVPMDRALGYRWRLVSVALYCG